MNPADKVTEMMNRKVSLRELKQPGSYLDLHEKLTLDLAREIERTKDPEYVSISWASQQEAQDYFNAQGFEKTLTRLVELELK